MLSIVVPTYNEGENVVRVVERLNACMAVPFEVIFVDDSKDDTPQILERLIKLHHNVRYIHRENERGLGTAVVRGFEIAKGQTLAVLDADLQHPPEVLNEMYTQIQNGADIVIPSRFIPGGDDGGLNFVRKAVSWIARVLGQVLLKRLRKISDSTSGFFMFRKEVISDTTLRPIGWKILIEILIRGKYNSVTEIPYQFQPREIGQSKMSLREQWNYIRHLCVLLSESPEDRRFFLFALVGLSGVVINMVIYSLLVKELHWSLTASAAVAGFVAMCTNFLLNDRYTWNGHARSTSAWVRMAKFYAVSGIGVALNAVTTGLVYAFTHWDFLLVDFMGIVVSTFWNYAINNIWTWNPGGTSSLQINIIPPRNAEEGTTI